MGVNLFIALVLVATVANLVMMVSNHQTATELQDAASTSASPSFKSRYDVLGAQVVQSWLEGDQAMVDTVEGVVWPSLVADSAAQGDAQLSTGISVVSVGYLGGQTESIEGTENYHESLAYSVVAADGSQYTATIDMGVARNEDGSVRPILLSAPLVEPRAATAVVSGIGAPNWTKVSFGSDTALAARLSDWAKAWTENDVSELKAISGDTSDNAYQGLQSSETWNVVEGSVVGVWAVKRPSDGNVVVRVTWDMETTAVAPATGTSGDKPTTSTGGVVSTPGGSAPVEQKRIRQSADVLVQDAGTGLPKVVDWGSPGDYVDLVAFSNAVKSEG